MQNVTSSSTISNIPLLETYNGTTPCFDSSNMILTGEFPGFKYYEPVVRTRSSEPQSIHESISEGPPSEGFHRDYFWMVQVGEIPSTRTEGDSEPEPVEVTASLSVDDLGEFSMGPLSISLPPKAQQEAVRDKAVLIRHDYPLVSTAQASVMITSTTKRTIIKLSWISP
mgnify:CR=1 FL=1